MGTNFYWHEKPPCEHCGHQPEGRHIGKSSAGWCFSLHVYPDEAINDLPDWQRLYEQGEIRDEYGVVLSAEEMTGRITHRGWSRPPDDSFSYAANHAMAGPNNLVRHQINGHCIGHGEGTWDLIVGEFS